MGQSESKNEQIIGELKNMLHRHMEHEESEIQELLQEIKALREDVSPLIEIYTNSIGTYKVLTWFFKFVALISAGIAAILFLKKI